ncbi:hypothetical protein [Rhodococcus jostii]|uniref:hypothetical protein n=1 Tax=Rhodococcus jostii TaxID=132919 RepID=UPI00365FC99F
MSTRAGAVPTDVEEIGGTEWESLLSQAQIVASKNVYKRLNELAQQTKTLNQRLIMTESLHTPHQHHTRHDTPHTRLNIEQLATLPEIADDIAAAHTKVQDTIRTEMIQ